MSVLELSVLDTIGGWPELPPPCGSWTACLAALADDPDLACLGALLSLRRLVLDLLPFIERLVAVALDPAEVDE